MLIILALAVLGDWRYDGFVADVDGPAPAAVPNIRRPTGIDPEPPSEPPAPTPVPAPRPPLPKAPIATVNSAPVIAEAGGDTRKAPPAEPPKSSPNKVGRWSVADRNGQVWEHSDPDWLRRWVAARDRELETQAARRLPFPPAGLPPIGVMVCPPGP